MFYFPGRALRLLDGSGDINAASLPFDKLKLTCHNVNMHRCFGGLSVESIDSVIGQIQGHGLRDYGVKIIAGACHIDGALHLWGVRSGSDDYDADGIDPSAAIWFADPNGGFNWGGPIYGESSQIGVRIETDGNMLDNVYSHSCWVRHIEITGRYNKISNLHIRKLLEGDWGTGVYIADQYNTIIGGTIDVDADEAGIILANGVGQRIEGVTIDCQSGTAGTSDANTTKAFQVTPATGDLYFTTIIAHINAAGAAATNNVIALDLAAADIIERNTIIITTGRTEADQLPEVVAPFMNTHGGTWTNTVKNTTNYVSINGKRWYPTADEF